MISEISNMCRLNWHFLGEKEKKSKMFRWPMILKFKYRNHIRISMWYIWRIRHLKYIILHSGIIYAKHEPSSPIFNFSIGFSAAILRYLLSELKLKYIAEMKKKKKTEQKIAKHQRAVPISKFYYFIQSHCLVPLYLMD